MIENKELIQISPSMRQFFQIKFAGACMKSYGQDIHNLIQCIYILDSEISNTNPNICISAPEKKFLAECDRLIENVQSFYRDKDPEKDNIDSPRFIKYQKSLSALSLINYDLIKIFYRLVSVTNLVFLTLPHGYILAERRDEKNYDDYKDNKSDSDSD